MLVSEPIDQDKSQGLGFSINWPSVWRKRAAGAPSTIRWSNVRLKDHALDARRTACFERRPGSGFDPSPSMAHSGGLIKGVKISTPNCPRLLTVNVLPVSSAAVSFPVRARSARARASERQAGAGIGRGRREAPGPSSRHRCRRRFRCGCCARPGSDHRSSGN